MRWSWPAERLSGWILPALAILAEGAWLAVVYVAIETTVDGRAPLLGAFELAVAAGLMAVAVRHRLVRPDDNPLTFFGVLAALGLVGWLWDAVPRDLAFQGRLADAIGYHPGGWLAVVAGMRGVGRAFEVDDRAVTRLVLVGVPALAVPWSLGQLGAGPLRAAFTEEAFVASLTFVAAGFAAAGLARLQEIGRETGVDWRTSRFWLATVLAVLALVLGIGVPAAAVLGVPVDAVARGLVGPALTLLGYAFLAVALVFALLSGALHALLSRAGLTLPPPMTPQEVERLPRLAEYTFEQLRGPLLSVGIAWVALAVLAIIVARTWIGRRRRGRTRIDREERCFRIPQRSIRLRLPRRAPAPRRPRLAPRDAVGAYLATLDDIAARDPGRARRDAESPRSHARRIAAGADLVALQADYSLARYGGRHLSGAEHRRAIGRWRRLRDSLRAGGMIPRRRAFD